MEISHHSPIQRNGSKFVKVIFTKAEVNSCNSTPLEIIKAPGPGKAILIERAIANVNAGSTPFSSGGQTFGLKYSGVSGAFAIIMQSISAMTSEKASVLAPGVPDGTDTNKLVKNKGISFTANGAVSGGDAGATITMYVWYSEIVL